MLGLISTRVCKSALAKCTVLALIKGAKLHPKNTTVFYTRTETAPFQGWNKSFWAVQRIIGSGIPTGGPDVVQFGQHIVEEDVVLERTVYLINPGK